MEPFPPLPEIVGVLRAGRALLGFRQEELAARAGVSRQTIARIEASGKGVPYETFEKVKRALEKEGVVFIDSEAERGPGVAIRRPRKSQAKVQGLTRE
ncbi:helix-turn-helix transcriptional regulator [Mesorhizobium sp. ZC-5]|uniref:helix-turn-helix transcriptional regulator n=1 Tax=Mesorhizobium sp. ZC-5 TaxID=2986066 RepID=UPI0021E81393|nr:helix-turn-helix domain-containing protein [Mesorhizobium sp. ZC-5]MCV3240638.1 helix-turn-helix domain-containing protein [Mesorhizobium sp. ZC-5]